MDLREAEHLLLVVAQELDAEFGDTAGINRVRVVVAVVVSFW
jgi:hypothetical protein